MPTARPSPSMTRYLPIGIAQLRPGSRVRATRSTNPARAMAEAAPKAPPYPPTSATSPSVAGPSPKPMSTKAVNVPSTAPRSPGRVPLSGGPPHRHRRQARRGEQQRDPGGPLGSESVGDPGPYRADQDHDPRVQEEHEPGSAQPDLQGVQGE